MEHTDIYGGQLNRGIWEWGFLYKETEVPLKERKKHAHSSEPYWLVSNYFLKKLDVLIILDKHY